MNDAALVARLETFSLKTREIVKREFLVSNVTTEAHESVGLHARRERLRIMLDNNIIRANPKYVVLGTSTAGGFGDMHLYEWSDEQGDHTHLKLLHLLTIRDVPDVLMTPSDLTHNIIYEMDINQNVTLKCPEKNASCSIALVHLQRTRIENDTPSIQGRGCWENIIFPSDVGTQNRSSQARSLSLVSTAPELLAISQFGNRKISGLTLSVKTLANKSCYPTAKEGKIATYSGTASIVGDSQRLAPELRRVYVTYSSSMLAAAKHVIIN
jgi:hypothetical protein